MGMSKRTDSLMHAAKDSRVVLGAKGVAVLGKGRYESEGLRVRPDVDS